MPAVPPGQPIAPGIVGAQQQFPQWGVGGGTPGNASGWKIVEAQNVTQKTNYADQGYLAWFSSEEAARAFISSESSAYGSGEPQNAIPGVIQIGDFFGALTQSNTWIRLAKIITGGVLVIVCLAHMTGADNAIANTARRIPAPF